MKPEIWWAVCWRGERESAMATTFDPLGIQVPMAFRNRQDARDRCKLANVTYGMKPQVVRKVIVRESK